MRTDNCNHNTIVNLNNHTGRSWVLFNSVVCKFIYRGSRAVSHNGILKVTGGVQPIGELIHGELEIPPLYDCGFVSQLVSQHKVRNIAFFYAYLLLKIYINNYHTYLCIRVYFTQLILIFLHVDNYHSNVLVCLRTYKYKICGKSVYGLFFIISQTILK